MFSTKFIAATAEYSTCEKAIPAPMLRKNFYIDSLPEKAILTVCGLGFYRLFVNGKEITKGMLAPYQSNPDQVLYYEPYNITSRLQVGKNVVCFLLGNGFLNSVGGWEWSFDKADYRSAPKVAMALETEKGLLFEADESVKTCPSPILYDDMRDGEEYDARKEVAGWTYINFDDSGWENAIPAVTPKGTPTVSEAPPLQIMRRLPPVRYHAYGNGFIFDFGENTSGFARIQLADAEEGQTLKMIYFERLSDDNGVYTYNIGYGTKIRERVQQDLYICKAGAQAYQPSFVWYGYRFLYVEGITAEQVENAKIEALEIRACVNGRGFFHCSDEKANTLVDMIRRSDYTNLFHYPVDCPHREKNGWTADAALSCEQMLLQMEVENVFAEWLKNIRAAQTDEGQFPGIVPTAGWGYAWGNGPAWDAIVFWAPYQIFQYRGRKKILEENASAIRKYLCYMADKRNEDGLLAYGLGDWCQTFNYNNGGYETPLEITDSLTGYDLCKKAAAIFRALQDAKWRAYAEDLGEQLKQAFCKKWIDGNGYAVKNEMQTAQAMAIWHGMFTPAKKQAAVEELVARIRRDGEHFKCGVVGGYVLFNVLAENGYADYAYRLIMQTSPPSYGYLVSIGETTLWENMYDFGDSKSNVYLKNGMSIQSLNHHFWGFVYTYFSKYVAGLSFNPNFTDSTYAEVKPNFIACLDYAQTAYHAPLGTISVKWERKEGKLFVSLSIPKGMRVKLIVQGEETLLEGGDYCKEYNEI